MTVSAKDDALRDAAVFAALGALMDDPGAQAVIKSAVVNAAGNLVVTLKDDLGDNEERARALVAEVAAEDGVEPVFKSKVVPIEPARKAAAKARRKKEAAQATGFIMVSQERTVTDFDTALGRLGVSLRLNDLSQAIEWLYRPAKRPDDVDPHALWEEWNAFDEARCHAEFKSRVGTAIGNKVAQWRVGASDWRLFCRAVAAGNRTNPFRDYVRECKAVQDGPDLDEWLIQAFGCRDTLLNREISRLFLVATVRRACLEPGAKFDLTPVLVGKQGSAKSSGLSFLMPAALRDRFFTDSLALFNANETDFVRSLLGRVIGVSDELVGVRKAQVERTKTRLTRTHDPFRLLFHDRVVSVARRCTFAATANPRNGRAGLPPDPSGQRRWVVVHVPAPNPERPHAQYRHALDWFDAWREHLWALAWTEAMKGEPLMLSPEAVAEQESMNDRHTHEPNEPFCDWLQEFVVADLEPGDSFSLIEKLYRQRANGDTVPVSPLTPRDSKTLSACLDSVGLEKYYRHGRWRWRLKK